MNDFRAWLLFVAVVLLGGQAGKTVRTCNKNNNNTKLQLNK